MGMGQHDDISIAEEPVMPSVALELCQRQCDKLVGAIEHLSRDAGGLCRGCRMARGAVHITGCYVAEVLHVKTTAAPPVQKPESNDPLDFWPLEKIRQVRDEALLRMPEGEFVIDGATFFCPHALYRANARILLGQ